MNKESKTLDKQQNSNDFIADVSKSFAVGVKVEIIKNIIGHQFNIGSVVEIIKPSGEHWLARDEAGKEWFIIDEEANVC